MIVGEIAGQFDTVREKCPLVHCITNYVTVNDVANAVLAIGASPIMADDINEAADIASVASALVINMGTLNQRTVASMLAAGKAANQKGIPVVFDPVGAGASAFRNQTAKAVMENVRVDILRGNLSEMSFMAGLEVSTKGVDSSAEDEKNDSASVAKNAAEKYGCIAAITGAVDTVSDGSRIVRISNGHPMLSKVTGTGCMTSGIVGAFAGASDNMLSAAAAGICAMGIAGELAYEKAGELGTGSFHIAVIDALSKIDRALAAERIRADEK
ncbi:hydroxyethylthiazole kinase [Ruminococcus sp. Marseille-P6503]|uniref:hydroxyethylthiazole kinase n=1 Tax=Ruminococcus sp. Marseille-P6503 TaxID=2364796 RepID=UPI000F52BFC7|nr:hydroxyethylthiazole kinase [Ruminococcus sp. Marseille-P6503]